MSCAGLLILLFTFSTVLLSLSSGERFNVANYVTRPDLETDSTKAFLVAWDAACKSKAPATMYVPPGRFILHKVEFSGPCRSKEILIHIEGTLLAPSDYKVIGNSKTWILFKNVDGVTVSGGILDAQGSHLWACKESEKNCPKGAASLEFSKGNNIKIQGLKSKDSQFFHIVISGSKNVELEEVTVVAPQNSPNTDGIHVMSSTDVKILNSRIGTGDDCISIGAGTSQLWIENVSCGPGHGISIGSLGKNGDEAGVNNITVKTATFTGTQNGVRIKTWAVPSKGFVRFVLFQHLTMKDVQNPIIIEQNYCPHNKDCPNQDSGIKISDLTYHDIHGSSDTETAVKFVCSRTNPCKGIRLMDVELTYKNQAAKATCANAFGSSSGSVQPSSCLHAAHHRSRISNAEEVSVSE